LLRLRGVRVVWTAHNLYPHDGGKDLWLHRFARWFLVRIVDRIFVHGTTAAQIVQTEFGVDSTILRVISHGNWIRTYPTTISRSEARGRLGLPEAAHIYLFVGLCKPYKGLEALIEAMAQVDPGAILVIAGKFPSTAFQQTLTALAERAGVDKVILRPGFVDV